MPGRRAWLVAASLFASGVLAPPAPAQPVQSDQQILIALERRWDEAFRNGDVDFVDSILAEEFIATYADGSRGDRDRELELVAGFDQRVDSSRMEDFTVRIYGDTAVVWLTHHLVGPVRGEPTEITYRYVDVWVYRDGRWQCVSSQSTRVGGG